MWVMNILEIKDTLDRIKVKKKLIYTAKEKFLSYATVKKIPDEDFNMASFFRMIKALGCIVTVDGKLVTSTVELGQLLAEKRSSMGITQYDVKKETGLTPQRIVTIEKGRNYRYSTLVRYLKAFDKDFIDIEIY